MPQTALDYIKEAMEEHEKETSVVFLEREQYGASEAYLYAVFTPGKDSFVARVINPSKGIGHHGRVMVGYEIITDHTQEDLDLTIDHRNPLNYFVSLIEPDLINRL